MADRRIASAWQAPGRDEPAGVREAWARPLLRRLGRLATLTAEDIERVLALGVTRRRWPPGSLLPVDARAWGPHFVVAGWACNQRTLRDGRRQILDFIAPGEGFGFDPLSERHTGHSVVALTALETVAAGSLADEGPTASPSGLDHALQDVWFEIEARRQDHMVRLGQLTGYERVAHFILEMQRRAGPGADGGGARSFPLPLTQEVMADALGLSVVHFNRVLRQLRAAGLLEIRGGMAEVRDPAALAKAAVLPVPQDPVIGGP
jgi:CRP-like cAMP-binding protein